MSDVLGVQGAWNAEIIKLIKQGLSDEEVSEGVPFRSDYVKRLRHELKGGD